MAVTEVQALHRGSTTLFQINTLTTPRWMMREPGSEVELGKEGFLEEVQRGGALQTWRRKSGWLQEPKLSGERMRQLGNRHSLQGWVDTAF